MNPGSRMIPELMVVALTAGLFGSTHCIGMCGAIVVLLENRGGRGAAGRRLIYNTGRLGFYVLLGALAGAFGTVLTRLLGVETGLFLLRAIAAMLVVALGLNLLFDLRMLEFLERSGARLWQALAPLARHVLPVASPGRALAAGFLWGALPCGLVYSSVAIAASTGSATGGALVMLAFWSGTVPALLFAGVSAVHLNRWVRARTYRRLAGVVLLAIGIAAMSPLAAKLGGQPHGTHAPALKSAQLHQVHPGPIDGRLCVSRALRTIET